MSNEGSVSACKWPGVQTKGVGGGGGAFLDQYLGIGEPLRI